MARVILTNKHIQPFEQLGLSVQNKHSAIPMATLPLFTPCLDVFSRIAITIAEIHDVS